MNILCLVAILLLGSFGQDFISNVGSSSTQAPFPFNESYAVIVLTDGLVFGHSEYVTRPIRKDVVISNGKILSLMDPSRTLAFIKSMQTSQVSILPISVQEQYIIPGLIDVHVHAIGGGGEQGLMP